MREMLNKVTFLTNIGFMMLNNAAFIIQWVILVHIQDEVGGYTMQDIMLLWGLAASCYGLAHIFFNRAFSLPELIINGKLDSYLVQPKSVLLSVITSSTNTSAIGDFLYGIVLVCVFCFSLRRLFLFLFFTVTGAVVLTAYAILLGSLSFWFVRADVFGNNMVNCAINFATYPEGIFEGAAKFLLYFVIPVGIEIYVPVQVMRNFDAVGLLFVTGYSILLFAAATAVFYRGLKRYTSSNLMAARM